MTAAGRSIPEGWCRACKVGLVLAFEAAIAGSRVLWCTHLAELWWMDLGAFAGRVFVNSGTAARDILLDAIIALDIAVFEVL